MPQLTKEQLAEIEEYVKTLPEEEREEKLKEVVSKMENEKPQCPFCLMSEGKIQTAKVFEDPYLMAVLEINPVNEGHTILFTKLHRLSISELTDPEMESFTKALKSLSISIKSFSDSLNIVMSEGTDSGNRFGHIVANLIPRAVNDNVSIAWKGKPAKEDVLQVSKEKIIENLPKEKKVVDIVLPEPEEVIKNKLKKKRLP